jgi:hypothetical protein
MKRSFWLAVALTSCVAIFSGAAFSQQGVDPELQTKIAKGFAIAPVPLNLAGRDSNLVGYGSYLINAVGDCNGCHTKDAQTEYANGGNPYFGQYPKVNSATYLGGGSDFGAFPDPTGPFPHIVTRNLTPDKSGKPAGGLALSDFMLIMRTGFDMDKVHPTCAGKPDGKCIPAPFKGDLLQIMPWPVFQNMTDRDLQAMYEYLSAIPCLEGGPNEPANRCPAPTTVPTIVTTAVAGPKNAVSLTRQFQLDGSKSFSADGKPLTYLWTMASGSPLAGIQGSTTATPSVQLGPGRGVYTFLLTITDSKGTAATDTIAVNFQGN